MPYLANSSAMPGCRVAAAAMSKLPRRHRSSSWPGRGRKGPRALRIDLERVVEVGDRLRIVALLQVDDAEIVEGVGIVGLQLQSFAAVGDGLG